MLRTGRKAGHGPGFIVWLLLPATKL